MRKQIVETLIKLTENNVAEVETIYDDGTSAIKMITFDMLANTILASKSKDEKVLSVETGVMPCNAISGVSTVWSRIYENDSRLILMYRKPQRTKITYYDTVYEEAGVPGLLYLTKYSGNTMSVMWVFAVDDLFITEDTRLYHYPFSNVGAHDGRVCFGRNNIYQINYESVTDLHSMPSMFLEMPNNDDSYGNNLSGLAHRKILEKLDKQDFPKEWLKPFMKRGEYYTLKNLIVDHE